ncbi:MAG: hypothetical protein V2B20_24385 [Pseudomonadota bacterium]
MKILCNYFVLISILLLQFPFICLASDQFDQVDAMVKKFGGGIAGILFLLFMAWNIFRKK